MSKPLIGMALAAVVGFAQPAAAQHIAVTLRLGDGPVAIRGYYASRPQYVLPRRFVCQPDGPVLYCWDRTAYRAARPVIYVYPADRRFVVARRDYRRDLRRDDDGRYWRRAAGRAFRRWHHRYGYAYGDRDGDDVGVVLAWRR